MLYNNNQIYLENGGFFSMAYNFKEVEKNGKKSGIKKVLLMLILVLLILKNGMV